MYTQLFILSLQAAEKLKITAHELVKLQVADGIIPVICDFLLNLIRIYELAILMV
jgi:hypothetical protein